MELIEWANASLLWSNGVRLHRSQLAHGESGVSLAKLGNRLG